MAKLASTTIYGDLNVSGKIRGDGVLVSGVDADKLDGKHLTDLKITVTGAVTASQIAFGSDGTVTLNTSLSTHTHDDRYYIESEIDSQMAGKSDVGHTHSYLPLAGGTMSGAIAMGSNNISGAGTVSATTFQENGTNLASKYLGIAAKAADSDKLDNIDSTGFLRIITDGTTDKVTISNSKFGVVGGSNISITYDDTNKKITIANTYSYSHPTGDGNLHVPATSTTNNTKVLKAGSTAGSISWGSVDWTELTNKPSTFSPSSHNHPNTEITGLGGAATLNVGTAAGTVAAGNDSRFHANTNDPTADQKAALTGTSGTPSSTNKYVTNSDSRLSDARTPTAHTHVKNDITDFTHTHSDATTSVAGFMSAADKTKLDGVATNANNYTHPTGDGNLHVPATSTTNNTKVLKAGATAGSMAWGVVAYSELSGVPTTFAPSAHKTSHASGGGDALTPADIGAAAASHGSHVPSGGSTGQYLKQGNAWATIAISEVNGLQTALDGKAPTHTHPYLSDSHAASGVTSGKITNWDTAYTHSQATHARTDATLTQSSSTNGNIKINGTETTVYTHPNADGDKHVPTTGTTNNNKVLKAGATAGTFAWGNVDWSELTNKPSDFSPSAHAHDDLYYTETEVDTKLGTKTNIVCLTVQTAAATVAKVTDETVTFAEGTLYLVRLKYGNTAASPTINGVNVRLGITNASTTTLNFSGEAVVPMLYDATLNKLQIMGSHDVSDDIESYTVRWNCTLQAGTDPIYDYKIVMFGTDGRLYPLTLENGTGTSKTVSNAELDIGMPILYYGYTADIAANGTHASYWYNGVTQGYLQYTANVASGWTAYRPVYIKGTIQANGSFKLAGAGTAGGTDFLTQTLPTTDDGYVYVLLGIMNNTTTSIRMTTAIAAYEFKDGKLRQYVPSHAHQISDVTGLQSALDGKSPTHTHPYLSDSHAASGVTSGKITNWDTAYTHSQAAHARTDATLVQSSSTNGNIKINGTETTVYTHPTTAGNVHIPAAGASGNFLKYSSAGTAAWATPAIADITGLQSVLDGKSATTHNHDTVYPAMNAMNVDANTITRSGFYHCNANVPTADSESDKAVIHNQYGGGAVWAVQIAISWRNGRMWFRNKENGTWEDWQEVSKEHSHPYLSSSHDASAVTSAKITNWDAAYTHSQAAHARTDATLTQPSSTNGNIKVNGTETTVYTHPSADGDKHVPATGTTNNNKVLKAGATAGTFAWGSVAYSELTGVPTSFTPASHDNTYHSATYVTQTEINTSISTHAGSATAHHSNANDPSSDQKAALAGTSGTPSSTNKYVTNSDSRLSDARTPTSHNHAATEITSGTLGTARGGTGLASFTSGGYFYASSTSAVGQKTPAQVLSDIGGAAASDLSNHTGNTFIHVPACDGNTVGQVLMGFGTDPLYFAQWSSLSSSSVGLGNVSNYGIATQAEAQAGTSDVKYMTPLRTKEAITSMQAVSSVNSKTGAVSLTHSDVGAAASDDDGLTTRSSTAPSSPSEGQLWYDTSNDKLKSYDGSAWQEVGGGLPLSGGTMQGDINFADYLAQRPEIKDYAETVYAHGTTGGAKTINLENGNIQTITLNANTTFTFSNPPASGKAGSLTIILSQGATTRTVTWPASVDWHDGAVPDLSTVSRDYVLTFLTVDGGTTWRGWLAGSAFS